MISKSMPISNIVCAVFEDIPSLSWALNSAIGHCGPLRIPVQGHDARLEMDLFVPFA
jgi:hypothetical protein